MFIQRQVLVQYVCIEKTYQLTGNVYIEKIEKKKKTNKVQINFAGSNFCDFFSDPRK